MHLIKRTGSIYFCACDVVHLCDTITSSSHPTIGCREAYIAHTLLQIQMNSAALTPRVVGFEKLATVGGRGSSRTWARYVLVIVVVCLCRMMASALHRLSATMCLTLHVGFSEPKQ